MTRTIQWLRNRRKAGKATQKHADAPAQAPPLPADDEALAALPEESPPASTPPEGMEDLALPEEPETGEEGQAALHEDTAATPVAQLLLRLAKALVVVLRAASAHRLIRLDPMHRGVRTLAELAKDEEALSTCELWLAEHEQAVRRMDADVGDLVLKALNTLVYALKVARVLEMPETMRAKLALAAVLHPAALARIPARIRNKPETLDEEERKAVARAWSEGAAWLKSCGLADVDVLRAIEEVPERLDGSGPKGLSGNEISTLGRILGLLSLFEALIHYRPWRKRLLPRDAVALIIKQHKRRFEHAHLKALIESVSLYPPGTWVRLNSGEVAEVVRTHFHHPLRPVVEVRFSKSGEPVVPRRVDLLEMPNLRIEACMYPEDLPHVRKHGRQVP